jgi:hypothetical protein
MRRAPRTEAVRAVQKVLLIDRFQHHRHRTLQNLVLQRGDSDGARPLPVALGDLYPPDRWRVVRARLQPVEERAQILLQVLLILGCRLAVHPGRTILPRATKSLSQKLDVDVVGQAQEAPLRVLPGQLCYPL